MTSVGYLSQLLAKYDDLKLTPLLSSREQFLRHHLLATHRIAIFEAERCSPDDQFVAVLTAPRWRPEQAFPQPQQHAKHLPFGAAVCTDDAIAMHMNEAAQNGVGARR